MYLPLTSCSALPLGKLHLAPARRRGEDGENAHKPNDSKGIRVYYVILGQKARKGKKKAPDLFKKGVVETGLGGKGKCENKKEEITIILCSDQKRGTTVLLSFLPFVLFFLLLLCSLPYPALQRVQVKKQAEQSVPPYRTRGHNAESRKRVRQVAGCRLQSQQILNI